MGKKSSIICLHIIAVLNFLLLLLVIRYAAVTFSLLELQVIIIAVVITIIAAEIIVRGLKKEKYWGWVASIIFFGMNIPSLFIVVSIIGLIGLFKKETVATYTRVSD